MTTHDINGGVGDYEIIEEDADPSVSPWKKLRRNLTPLLRAGQAVLGQAYAGAARRAIERQEALEDLQAERNARRRLARRSRAQR